MIKLPWLMQRIQASAAADVLVRSALDGAISAFERETGSLWNRRTGRVMRLRVGPDAVSRGLWIPACSVENLALRESPSSFAEAEGEDAIDSDEWDLDQMGSVARVAPVGRSWSAFMHATFDCGFVELPSDFHDVREAIVQQVEYELARNRGENVAAVSRFGKDTQGVTFRDGNWAPAFADAARRHRAVLV